ncbi:MAG: class I SAM-dependent methyltransferase [Candidatus Thorarchaeota archaeon]
MSDIFGKIMRDALRGVASDYVLERDDGYINSADGTQYVAPISEWWESEKLAILKFKGPLLDIGCGAGRIGKHCQENNIEYTGIDISPLAIEICEERGFDDFHIASVENLDLGRNDFHTIVMYGNNFGLLGYPEKIIDMLKNFHRITAPGGIILAGSRDPTATDEQIHLDLHERNRHAGRSPGFLTLRLRYKGEVTDWWNLLLASPELMEELAHQSGWKLERIFGERKYYIGLLRKR